MSLYRRAGKRVLDLAVAVGALALLAPVFALVALIVRRQIGSPVLYRQVRPGLHGRLFTLVKFRTMTDARDAAGTLLPDDRRLTRAGTRLRALSLDELPELLNVIRGDMSLVGPRPLLPAYLTRYTAAQARRHLVRPGITGWAQIHGRNDTTWEQRLLNDQWYVDHVSLGLDLRILLQTASDVVRRRGITAEGHATMPEFTGTMSGDSR